VARPVSPTLTEGELRLMKVLWDRGPSTTAEVVAALTRQGIRLAESTVRTLMGILDNKQYVKTDGRSRTKVYRPVVGRDEARRRALRHVMSRFFDDSPEEMVLSLIRDERVSAKELARLRRIILEDS
jgi:predicted transcriptional regulator